MKFVPLTFLALSWSLALMAVLTAQTDTGWRPDALTVAQTIQMAQIP